jgi:putative ABC transport system substrate-binding protein
MDSRRELLLSLAAALATVCIPARAQSSGKVWRIGFYYFGSRQSAEETGRYAMFLQGMRELGYVEGKNYFIEARYADGKVDRLPALTTEMNQIKPDLIVATGGPVYDSLKKAAVAIPTVVTVTSDPIIAGIAKTLARPGGYFTGLSENNAEYVTKHLELLRIALPKLTRLAVLANPTNASSASQLKRLRAAALPLGIQLISLESTSIETNTLAFDTLVRERMQALIIVNDTFFVQQARQLAELAIKNRLPSIFGTQDYARAGGLMSYGSEINENFQRAAGYVDKIFKGAKAGDLPIEQPTRLLLTVNRKTAKLIGLNLPQELLLRADKVIE